MEGTSERVSAAIARVGLEEYADDLAVILSLGQVRFSVTLSPLGYVITFAHRIFVLCVTEKKSATGSPIGHAKTYMASR